MWSASRIIITSLFILSLAPTGSFAERLGPKACKQLKQKRNALIKSGAAKHMAKGAAWAKKNLKEPELKNIKTYIELSENLLFQCGAKTMKYVDLRSRKVSKAEVDRNKSINAPKKAKPVPKPDAKSAKQKKTGKSAVKSTSKPEKKERIAKASKPRKAPVRRKLTKKEKADQAMRDEVRKFLKDAE